MDLLMLGVLIVICLAVVFGFAKLTSSITSLFYDPTEKNKKYDYSYLNKDNEMG